MKPFNVVKTNIKQIVFVVVSVVLMVIVSYLFVQGVVERQIDDNAKQVLETANALVSSQLRELEVVTFFAGVSVQNMLDDNMSLAQIEAYMRRSNYEMTTGKTTVNGFMFMGALIDGELVFGLDWMMPEGYAPEDRPWYTAAMSSDGQPVFSGPYLDLRTGQLIISFSLKLMKPDGSERGVLFCDMNLDLMSAYVASLQSQVGGYGILTTETGILVAYPDKTYIGRTMGDIGYAHAKIVEQFAEGLTQISRVEMVNSAGDTMIAYYQQMGNGWYVGVSTPIRSYYKDVYNMALVLSLIGLVMMVLLNYFIIRLSGEKLHADYESMSKSSFLARMSHEIRTPLNSILGMAEIIAHKDISQDIFEHVSIIRQSGDNLLAIINDILDFSKIEVGQLVIASDKYYISSLINDALNVTRVRLIEKPVMFSLRVDCDLPECLYGDNVRIRQVLLNLLSNAIKYTSEGFITLEVTFEELPNEQIKLIFRVSDSGIGIQLEDIEELFTDFTRVESATTHAVEGSGLGLSIARSLCRAMGGDIVVTSEFGSGSVFQAEVIQGKEPGRKLATVDNAQEKSLLIFEDRPLYLESLLYATDSLGVPSQCVDSLEEFIALLKDNPKYAYAFVSSRYIAECLFILGSSVSTVRLVNMVDFGDASAYKNISNIIMPVYCVNIANLLNSAIGAGMPVNKDRMTRFFAPNAKVLIVDDIATNLRVSKELMALYGLNIHTCMSGSAAIELATLNRYDLVFMDHMMPIMDGVEAVARIRAIDPNDPYYRDLPIVALTANALTGQREALLQSGMNDFLEKPIDTQRLNTILLKWIPKEKQWNREELVNLPELSEQCRDLDIPGVSIETGLRNSGGSMPVFLDILSDFCADADLRRTQIEQSLKDNDLNLYMTLVHAMKGASRSVGVGEFADFAALMEEAARNQDRETIDKRTGELLSDLLELTQKIRTALKSFTESSQKVDDISDNQLEAQLLLLKPALKNMDIQTVNTTLLELVNVALTPQSRELVTSIERNILMFEYDDAIEKIDSVLKYRKP